MNNLSMLNETLAQLYKDLIGKGPKSLKTYLKEDFLIIKFEVYDIEPIYKLETGERGKKILPSIYKIFFKEINKELQSLLEEVLEIKIKEIFFDAEKNAFSKEKVIVALLEEEVKL